MSVHGKRPRALVELGHVEHPFKRRQASSQEAQMTHHGLLGMEVTILCRRGSITKVRGQFRQSGSFGSLTLVILYESQPC